MQRRKNIFPLLAKIQLFANGMDHRQMSHDRRDHRQMEGGQMDLKQINQHVMDHGRIK